jgi:hypothetical protein
MRPLILSIVDGLLARHRATTRVDLNDISEMIGSRAVSYDEVEYIVARLEAEGFEVGEPMNASEVRVMRVVLSAARELRSSLRRTPTIAEVARASGHPAHVVRRALERGVAPRAARGRLG